MGKQDYPVVIQLRKREPDQMYNAKDIKRYADYIQAHITEHIAKGHYTLEHANQMTIADLFCGNDGD